MDKKTVLFVDDNKFISEAIPLLLEDHFKVIKATDGRSALMLLASYPVDIIVSDYNMFPEFNGVQFCKEAKAFKPKTPFILMSSWPKVEGQEIADRFLEKSEDVTELVATINELLAQAEPAPQ